MATKKQTPEEEVLREEARPDPVAPHPAGIRRALWLFAVLAAAFVVPYAHPALDDFRPWSPGSKIPFTTLFEFRPPTRPRLAGVQERRASGRKSAQELLEAAPLPEVAPSEPAPAPEPSGETGPTIDPSLRLPPEAWAGMTLPIEDPTGSMRHFYARLLAIARGEPEMARVALYSDSINGSDRTSRALREQFAARFGDGGKGWVPVSPGWQYQRHKNVVHRHQGWRVFVVNRGDRDDGRYGLGGVLAENRRPRASARWGTTRGAIGDEVSLFQLFYQGHPEGGSVTLTLDDGAPEPLSTQSDEVQDLVHRVTAPEASHRLALRASEGRVRLYGMVMENEPPGVVVDGLMLVGAFTRVLLNFDPEHWARQVALRQPDLLAFWLGGNDSVSDGVGFRPAQFVDNFTQVLHNARAGRPEASCLVISVLDSAEEVSGRVRSRRRVPRVVEAQREAARNAGCAFFDGYEAIGGAGTMVRWSHASPRLVSVDYRHLTGEGATVFASLLYKAMLRAYDQWLAVGAPPAADPSMEPTGEPGSR